MPRPGRVKRTIRPLHLRPDVVGHGDAVAVVVETVGGDDVCLGAEADRGSDRLTGEHVRSVEFTADDPVEENFPVGLGFEPDIQTFRLKEQLLLGNHQGSTVRELDEAERECVLFHIEEFRPQIEIESGRDTQS